MLSRGFTTIRDVGGANRHYKNATADWLIPGPRILQCGPVMSQTGGHGDMDGQDTPISCCQINPAGHGPQLSQIADGVDACLKVARKIMQSGADHIKICSSGGVASETDKLESSQFTVPEIKAICDTVRMMVSEHSVNAVADTFFARVALSSRPIASRLKVPATPSRPASAASSTETSSMSPPSS